MAPRSLAHHYRASLFVANRHDDPIIIFCLFSIILILNTIQTRVCRSGGGIFHYTHRLSHQAAAPGFIQHNTAKWSH